MFYFPGQEFSHKWDKLEENLGMLQLCGIATSVYCGLHLIVISPVFANPGLCKITGINVVKMARK